MLKRSGAPSGPEESSSAQGEFRALRALLLRLRLLGTLFVRTAGGTAASIGLLVLAGWALGIPQLQSVLPGAVAMKANTALALVLAGGALVLHDIALRRGRARPYIAMVLGAGAAAIGIATAAEYLFDLDLRIDQALALDVSRHYARAPGRMSPYSAGSLAGLGIALVLASLQRWHKVAVALAAPTVLVGVLWLVGYAWRAPELVTDEWLPPVALHTALAFVLLGAGALVLLLQRRPLPRSYRMLVDRVERKLFASIVAVVLALIVMGGLTYDAAAVATRVAERLATVRAFREQLAAFQDETEAAVLAQRDYLLTGDPEQARRWSRWILELPQRRASLREAAPPSAAELQPELHALDAALARLYEVLEPFARLYVEKGSGAAPALARVDRGTAAIVAVRSAVDGVDARERELAAADEQLLMRSRQQTLLATFLSWLAAAAMLGATVLAIRREMAARSRTERQLRRTSAAAVAAHHFLQSVIENIPHMIFIKEARQLRFVLLNPAGERIMGLRQPDVLGKSHADFLPRAQAEHLEARDREVLERGEVVDVPEEQIESATTGVRVLHTRKIPLYGPGGRPTHLLGISEDVTTAREQDRQLRALNQELAARAAEVERLIRAKSEFLATMSHEIRTPMNGMLGMLELLSLTQLDDQQRRMTTVVRESGQSLLRIINDILDFSKIEAEKLEVREEVASLAALVRDIRDIHTPVAGSKAVRVRAVIDPALSPASWLDPVRLRQVLNNLAGNAVKFTRAGEVEIRADVMAQTPDAQSVRLSVRDTGPGISPEEQQRLFSPFVQVGDARGGTSGGSGLGLVIARRLVELMGGQVTLESAPGTGTTVSFTLHLRRAAPELLPKDVAQQTLDLRESLARVRPAPDADRAAAEGTLVLVVDDHPVNRTLLRDQLAALGYACEAAEDGREALQKWRSGRFGLVLTDCQMPGMDGYELARRIRVLEVQEARPRSPILACTAAAGELAQALAAGMDDCLLKPVQLTEMREKLQRWLPLPPAAEPGTQAPPVIDPALIASNWGSAAQTLPAIQQAFVASVKDDAGALREAVGRRDFGAVGELAHRMIGASRMVGSQALEEPCRQVQAASGAGDVPALQEAMAAMEKAVARVMLELG